MDMQQQQVGNNQPQIKDEFIVKVKLLTNQVYEFVIEPEVTTVARLKQMILERLSIPLQKQRIVFGGKQLIDENKVTDYVKQSGNTVHLIAKMTTSQPESTTTSATTQQQSSTSQQPQQQPQQQPGSNPTSQQPFNPFANLFGGLGIGQPQATTITFGNMNELNQGIGGILGSLGIRIPPVGVNVAQQPQQQPRPATTQATHNNPFQTPPSNTNRPNQQNNQPTSVFNATQQQPQTTQQSTTSNQPQQSQPVPWSVSNEPILRLNQTISTLNLPPEPVLENRHMSLRQQTAQYLRRLQHQYMRMIPQLNRSVQLLNEGRVTHLEETLRLFEAIDWANAHAQEAIRKLINLPVNQQSQQQQPLQSSQQPQISVQTVQIEVENNDNINTNQQGQNVQLGPNVQATIIVQTDDGIDEESNQQPATNNQHQVFNQTFNLGSQSISGLLSALTGQPPVQNNQATSSSQQQQQPNPLGGLNIGGLMSMFGGMMNPQAQQVRPQQQQPSQQTNLSTQNQQTSQQQTPHVHGPGCNHQQQPQQSATQQIPTQQPSQQLPQFDIGNLANMASMLFNPQAQSSQSQSTSSQPQTQTQQNPMGGLMGIFNSLQQSGGMGELMNMSLGETLEEGGAQPTIYSSIFKSFTGSDVLTCFTSKNFDFLDRKYETVRENFLHAISIAGCQQDLVQHVTEDISHLLIPKNNVTNYESCLQGLKKIIKKHVTQIVRLTMNRGDAKYSQKVTQYLKLAFCQGIDKVVSQINPSTLSNGQSATSLVFQNIKENCIRLMDDFIQGLSGMFYSFIERDLIRVYNEHKEEQKRRQQRTLEQAASEEQLLKQIEIESKKDIEYLKNFKHSQYYGSKPETE